MSSTVRDLSRALSRLADSAGALSSDRIPLLRALGETRDPAAIPVLSRELAAVHPDEVLACLDALDVFGAASEPALRERMTSDDEHIARNAALGLARRGDAEARKFLLEGDHLEGTDSLDLYVACCGRGALLELCDSGRELGSGDRASFLWQLVHHFELVADDLYAAAENHGGVPVTRVAAAVEVIGAIGAKKFDARAEAALLNVLQHHPVGWVRSKAVDALVRHPGDRVVDALGARLRDPGESDDVKETVRMGLEEIGTGRARKFLGT